MSALPELDDLELDRLAPGDRLSFATTHGGLYSPQGDLLVAGAHEATDEQYRAAWRRVEAWSAASENRRGDHFSRGGEDFLVVTQYLGLDMTTAFGLAPHVPQTWETQILSQAELLYLWRYHTRAAAFAGHDTVVTLLAALPDVTVVT